MIITELLAENFRKYQSLQVGNLPEQGLIVVAGLNESGKTSLGDAISFALFGRTDTLRDERVGKLVLWGADEATVTLSFRHQNKHYRLARRVDSDGNQSSTLLDADKEEILSDTNTGVTQHLQSLLGYSYSAFVRTFYWSQKISSDQRADADSLQAMAGVRAYAQLDKQLQSEQQDDRHALEAVESAYHASLVERDEMGLEEEHLPELLEIRETLEDHQHRSLTLMKHIHGNSLAYAENHDRFHTLLRKSHSIGRMAVIGIGLLLLVLLIWAALALLPKLIEGIWSTTIAQTGLARGLLWGGVLLAIATSLLLIYGWYLEQYRLHPLRKQSFQLGSFLRNGLSYLHTDFSTLLDGQAEHYLQQRHLLDAGQNLRNEALSELSSVPGHWTEQVQAYEAPPGDVTLTSGTIARQLEDYGAQLGSYVQTVNNEVGQEQQRVEHYMTLKHRLISQENNLNKYHVDLKVKDKALDLIKQASRYSIGRFNNIVRHRCQDLLSEFTQSHYRELEIDNDFALHVLSQEKGGYLEFDEISAGTQRQIGLAMRIALANSLAESSDAGAQFLYLDEPFVFFDDERTTATLRSLKEATRGNLSQIWVTVQSVPDKLELVAARIIHCQPGDTTLST